MKRWSVMATRFRDGRLIARELPLAGGIRFTDELRGSGTLDMSIRTEIVQANGQIVRRPLSARIEDDYWTTVLWPMFMGQPVGCYLFTRHGWKAGDGFISMHGDRADGILNLRLIRDTLTFSQVDQNDIYRDLLRYGLGLYTQKTSDGVPHGMTAYAYAASAPWITYTAGLSQTKRDRLETPGNPDDGYPAAARKVIGQMLDNLTALGGQPGAAEAPGPETRCLYQLDSTGMPQLVIDIGTPSVGISSQSAPRIVFEHPGGNVTDLAEVGDGTGMVFVAEVLGQDNNGTRPVGVASDDVRLGNGYPLLARTWSESTVSDQSVLNAKAAGRVAAGSSPNVGWQITVNGSLEPKFGRYAVGDWATLRLLQGRTRLPDRAVRITGWTVQVDPSGDSELITPMLGVS